VDRIDDTAIAMLAREGFGDPRRRTIPRRGGVQAPPPRRFRRSIGPRLGTMMARRGIAVGHAHQTGFGDSS
jgi:hypothetical protein